MSILSDLGGLASSDAAGFSLSRPSPALGSTAALESLATLVSATDCADFSVSSVGCVFFPEIAFVTPRPGGWRARLRIDDSAQNQDRGRRRDGMPRVSANHPHEQNGDAPDGAFREREHESRDARQRHHEAAAFLAAGRAARFA